MNPPLTSTAPLTTLALQKGIHHWKELITYIHQLPYGRNSKREDLSIVLVEEKGSCSSKHALLKSIALENKFSGVLLLLAIYQMNATNTPKIAHVLKQYALDNIPEAHCYLSLDEERVDITFPNSSFNTIKKAILFEREISPAFVFHDKVKFHKDYLKDWLTREKLPYSLEQLWEIREACIHNLMLP